jgi:hypothetical protein
MYHFRLRSNSQHQSFHESGVKRAALHRILTAQFIMTKSLDYLNKRRTNIARERSPLTPLLSPVKLYKIVETNVI